MTAVPLPSTAQAGGVYGVEYVVTITNKGPSNISSLFLETTSAAVPVGLANDPDFGACASGTTSRLFCAFGALVAGDSVTVHVTYQTPRSGQQFDPGFLANTTGASPNDKKKTSHGDTLFPSNNPVTTLRSDQDFAGGFLLANAAVSDKAVGNQNKQQTTVLPPSNGLVVTVEDGAAPSFDCPATVCTGQLFGEWSKVTVRSADHVNDPVEIFPMFKVVLTVRGNLITGNGTFSLVHVKDDGSIDVSHDSDPCGSTPHVGCLDVTKNGGNYVFTTWVDQNGGFKGSRP